jgi:TPR repeat protein
MAGQLARASFLALAALLLTAGSARADSGLGPAEAEKTLGHLGIVCVIQATCPLTAANLDTLKRAVAGDRDNAYLFGLNLILGDGAPVDRVAGMAWVVKAAEAGAPLAVDYVERKLQNGEGIEVDETKMAAALKPQADAGDVTAMLALGTMTIRGRGVPQDPQAGLALLRKAAERDTDGRIDYQIAELILIGTNGLPHDHDEAMKWYARAASHGNIDAMATLGGLWANTPMTDILEAMKAGRIPQQTFEPDIVQSYCWRARAAMMGSALAQYELALMLSRDNSDRRGNAFAADLVQADFWFRLGAREPDYDNSQVRGAIEPKMTTAQLDQAKKMVADWRKLDFAGMQAAKITIPGNVSRACPAMT